MEQILHNLILNATQHAPKGSNIELIFAQDSELFIVQVRDIGFGLSEIDISSIFDKFYRGEKSIAGGTGLGLSIVKGFVEAQKGTITAANHKTGGAVFTVKIPTKTSTVNFE